MGEDRVYKSLVTDGQTSLGANKMMVSMEN